MRGGEERGRGHRCPARSRSSGSALVVFLAHGQVDEGEDIELDHDGEAQEDGIEDQHIDAQFPVQPPLVHMNS